RSEPKYRTSPAEVVYRAAKPWRRLSLSGSPPASFHAHWLMSCGSFEPPPVKMDALELGSATQVTAVAPPEALVLDPVEQSVPNTWWYTLAQSSPAGGPLTALPSSSNAPVSWTAATGPVSRATSAPSANMVAREAVSHLRRLLILIWIPTSPAHGPIAVG